MIIMKNKFISDILYDVIEENKIESSDLKFDTKIEKSKNYNIDSFEINNLEKANELSRPIGKYILITLNKNLENEKINQQYKNAIIKSLKLLLPNVNNDDTILIVGLGNEKIDSDSLGHSVCNKVIVTRLNSNINNVPKIAIITPSVMGITGIESVDVISSIVSKIKPKCVIIIDSLCATSYKRLGCSIQITNAGLTPGEGVKSPKKPLNKASLNCEVISIGVPLMIYAKTFCKDNNDINENLIVTFHDINYIVNDMSKLIAEAINMTFLGIEHI